MYNTTGNPLKILTHERLQIYWTETEIRRAIFDKQNTRQAFTFRNRYHVYRTIPRRFHNGNVSVFTWGTYFLLLPSSQVLESQFRMLISAVGGVLPWSGTSGLSPGSPDVCSSCRFCIAVLVSCGLGKIHEIYFSFIESTRKNYLS